MPLWILALVCQCQHGVLPRPYLSEQSTHLLIQKIGIQAGSSASSIQGKRNHCIVLVNSLNMNTNQHLTIFLWLYVQMHKVEFYRFLLLQQLLLLFLFKYSNNPSLARCRKSMWLPCLIKSLSDGLAVLRLTSCCSMSLR